MAGLGIEVSTSFVILHFGSNGHPSAPSNIDPVCRRACEMDFCHHY
jgi:hypothetical protein